MVPNKPNLTISVIIPHYDDIVRLERCLLGLERQDLANTEIVVVDNASPHSLDALQKRFAWARFVTQSVKGAGPARNMGVEVTTAPYLLFLDADCVPESDWLEVARRISLEGVRSIVGGSIDVFDETPRPRSGAEAFETVFAFDQEIYITKKGFSVTANLLVPRNIFEKVGPFKPNVSEDFDWCQRARAAGFELQYISELRISHPTRNTWPDLRKKWLRLTQESYGLLQNTLLARLLWSVRALAMPISAIIHLPRVFSHPSLSAIERLKAACTLIRLRFARMIWMLSIMV